MNLLYDYLITQWRQNRKKFIHKFSPSKAIFIRLTGLLGYSDACCHLRLNHTRAPNQPKEWGSIKIGLSRLFDVCRRYLVCICIQLSIPNAHTAYHSAHIHSFRNVLQSPLTCQTPTKKQQQKGGKKRGTHTRMKQNTKIWNMHNTFGLVYVNHNNQNWEWNDKKRKSRKSENWCGLMKQNHDDSNHRIRLFSQRAKENDNDDEGGKVKQNENDVAIYDVRKGIWANRGTCWTTEQQT